MPSFKLYVIQDGADFYCHRDSACEQLVPSLTRTAPFSVLDGDFDAAANARAWFRGLMSDSQQFEFVGED